jgi:hypothetical protein
MRLISYACVLTYGACCVLKMILMGSGGIWWDLVGSGEIWWWDHLIPPDPGNWWSLWWNHLIPVQGEWRRLNTESPGDDEQTARLWVRRGMERELSVVVTSTAEHCECRTRVRQVCSRPVCFDVPDDDTERLRAELEGIGIGFEDFEQQAARFQRLAADPCVDP